MSYMTNNMLTYHFLSLLLSPLFFTTFLLLTTWKSIQANGSNMTKNWTHLPSLSPLGSNNKLTSCSGCHLPFDNHSNTHKCIFLTRISQSILPPSDPAKSCTILLFSKSGHLFHLVTLVKGPTVYNIHCVPPISLSFVSCVPLVRRLVGNLIPISHQTGSCSTPRALNNACSTIRRIDTFFSSFTLTSTHHQLHLPPLSHPSLNISIPLFWSMEHHTSTPSSRSQGITPTWNTPRAQRSALSIYSAWTAASCFPRDHYRDNDNMVLSAPSISPSDNILSRFTTNGIGSRLGTNTIPSQALTYLHII